MAANTKYERSLFSHDEFESIRVTHHPAIYDLTIAGLRDLQGTLRAMRDKERTLARQKRREVRGKAEPRGGSYPGTEQQPRQRKQVLAAALRRVNKELKRQRALEARAANVEAARRALAQRRAAGFVHHPAAGDTPGGGGRPLPNRRRKTKVPRSQIGRISKHTKVTQSIRDSKG